MNCTAHHPHVPDTAYHNVLFLGDENIGKTTFINAICNYLRDDHDCKVRTGNYLVYTQHVFNAELGQGDLRLPIRLLNLPAGTTAASRGGQYPTKVNLIVCCFAIDIPISLANVYKIWLPEYRRIYNVKTPRVLLLGLRSDLRENPERKLQLWLQNRDPVTFQWGRDIHEDYQFNGEYMECSAETDPEDVKFVTDELMRQVFFSF